MLRAPYCCRRAGSGGRPMRAGAAASEFLTERDGAVTGGVSSGLALGRLAGWYAVVLRVGSAVACAVAGPLAATPAVSGPWLALIIVALCGWSVLFAWAVWRRGLAPLIVLADVAVIMVMLSAHSHVVPAAAISAGTTWMLPLASTAVLIPQLAFRPAFSLPMGGVDAVAYSLTVTHPTGVLFLVVQAVVTAALMTLVRRGGRSADAVIASDLLAVQEIRAEAARRADEKEQYRQLHDTILSTLTMIASGAFARPSPTLSTQAAHDLQVLSDLPAVPDVSFPDATPLGERLRQVAQEAAPLRVSLSLAAATLPPAVAREIALCVREALRNVTRHAGTSQAEIRVCSDDVCLLVEVTDRGKGFDPRSVAPWRRGIQDSICERMSGVGGNAVVTSQPGAGTTIALRWPG